MKNIKLTILAMILAFGKSYSQTDQITFQHEFFDLNANPRTQLDYMSIKLFDDYHSNRPSPATAPGNNSYGTLFAIYGRNNHWEHNLYFGADKKVYYRMAVYPSWTAENGTLGGYNEWRTFLDSKSNVESSGVLRLTGNGDHYFSQGYVGIGTTSPKEGLDVHGAINIYRGSNGKNSFIMSDHDPKIWSSANSSSTSYPFTNSDLGHLILQPRTSALRDILFITGDGDDIRMSIKGNGNVGIGTTNPDTELAVKGIIHSEEVKVDLNVPAPDYVFESDYELRTLKETKEYIGENKHLPEIPSAKEMEENGVDLGDMNMRLLKKIEELTLHLIEQNERVEQLEKEMSTLKNK